MMKYIHALANGGGNPFRMISNLSKLRMDAKGTVLSRIPLKKFFEHVIVFGTTGAGKSNLYELLIKRFMPDVLEGEMTLIVVDGSVFPNRVMRHVDVNLKAATSDRVVVMDPQPGKGRSYDHYLRANIFDIPDRIKDMVSPDYLEGMYLDIFQSLFDKPLTDQMKELFSFAVQLMDAAGKPSIRTLRDILRDPEDYLYSHDYEVDSEVVSFYESEILTGTGRSRFTATKNFIVGRLNGILKSVTLREMLCSDAPRINLFEKVLDGCLLLVATRTTAVGNDTARTLSRLAMMIGGQTSQMKASVNGVPSIMLVDEAHEATIEGDIPSIRMSYKKDRKNHDGRALALQQPDDFCPGLFKTVTNNSAIKCVGRMENPDDAAKLAKIMGVTVDDLMGLQTGQFCIKIRGMHDKGIIVDIPPGSLGKWKNDEQEDRMKAEALKSVDKFRSIMAKRYGAKIPERRKLKTKRRAA